LTYVLDRKIQLSIVPFLIIIGVLFGPVLGLIAHDEAHAMFEVARVLGLVVILYAEGHSLKWLLLKKHLGTIGVLDTLGLLITAGGAALLFCWLFDAPILIGMLFGAIVSATDPASLIPVFKQNKVDTDLETVIVTESIFNDPLGIVLTTVAIALLLPDADSARTLQWIAGYITLTPAVVVYFLYSLLASIVLGVLLGTISHRLARYLDYDKLPILFGLSVAFGGFALGEAMQGSGYLVATVVGIVLGNHRYLFKETPKEQQHVDNFVRVSEGFEDSLAQFATLFIFILLGASLQPETMAGDLPRSLLLGIGVLLLCRPIAVLGLLWWSKWNRRQALFMALEGPRGVVPSALAGMPLALGATYHSPLLMHWGGTIFTAVMVTVFLSVTLETMWMKRLNHLLFGKQ
jgi:NhaP-type Na+/H+ or K+/H+ antiporter